MSNEIQQAMRPRDVANMVGKYIQEGNLDAVGTFFHPDCVVAFPPDAPPVHGIEATKELFSPFVAVRANLISEVTGELIQGDTALVQATWRVEGPDGSIMGEGNSTEVLKQYDDGSWVYFIDCPTGPPAI